MSASAPEFRAALVSALQALAPEFDAEFLDAERGVAFRMIDKQRRAWSGVVAIRRDDGTILQEARLRALLQEAGFPSPPAYDQQARDAAIEAARAGGFETKLDIVRIAKGKHFETLQVQSSAPPYMHLLVRIVREAARIDVHGNDADRKLLRSLARVEEDIKRRYVSRGEIITTYEGTVAAGPDVGKAERWALVYYP